MPLLVSLWSAVAPALAGGADGIASGGFEDHGGWLFYCAEGAGAAGGPAYAPERGQDATRANPI